MTMVVFWDARSRGWKHVCDGQFSDFFHSLDQALDSAEQALGIAGMVSRHRCRDVPPRDRHGGGAAPSSYREHARSYGAAAGAGTKFYKPAKAEAPKHPPATKVRTDQLFQQSFLAPASGAKTAVQRMIEANLAKVKPRWAVFLGLKGSPPYTKEQVKTAYREAARQVHPDVGGYNDLMAKLNVAYEEGLAAAEAIAVAAAPKEEQVFCAICQKEAKPDDLVRRMPDGRIVHSMCAPVKTPLCDLCRRPLTKDKQGMWECTNLDCTIPF
jgi:hypothetical protein